MVWNQGDMRDGAVDVGQSVLTDAGTRVSFGRIARAECSRLRAYACYAIACDTKHGCHLRARPNNSNGSCVQIPVLASLRLGGRLQRKYTTPVYVLST